MKLIKIESHPYDVGYHHNMVDTGEIKTKVNYVNPIEISSVTEWIGTLLNKGKIGTLVTMKNGDKFVDEKKLNDFLDYINANR